MSEEKGIYRGKDAGVIDMADIKERAEAGVGPEGAPQEEPVKPHSPFSAKFTAEGVLEMRVDLRAPVVNEDIFHMFRGWFDNTRDHALALILDQKEKYKEQQQKILSLKNGGKPGFFDGLAPFLKRK